MDPYLSIQVNSLAQGMTLLGPVARMTLHDLNAEAELKALAVRLGASPDVPEERRVTDPRVALSIAQSAQLSLTLIEHELPEALKGLRAGALCSLLNGIADRLGGEIRRPLRERTWGLYVIIDPQATAGREPLDVARAAIRGGARMLQLRGKVQDKGDLLPLANALKDLCEANEVVYIMNDHADLARAVEADGLHVGQSDLPVRSARLALEPWQIIGNSTHSVEEALTSIEQGADHVAVGAIYPTSTKEITHSAGLETLRQVRKAVGDVPIVAIGGINRDNVTAVVEAGADAISVISAVSLAPDPEEAARGLVQRIRAAGGRA
jgi:thiamine-phosphate diphosphorylase